MKLYLDTESIGLMGPVKLIQYSVDQGPIQFIRLPRYWQSDPAAVKQVWGLVDMLNNPDTELIGFNLSFDLFKLYQTIHSINEPEDSPNRWVQPFRCRSIDLYNHAVRFGPFAPWAFSRKTGRRVVVIRKLPKECLHTVVVEVEKLLNKRLPAGVKVNRSHHVVPKRKDLVTVSWVASASNGLKPLGTYYGYKTEHKLVDCWPLPKGEKQHLPYSEEQHDELHTQCDSILYDHTNPFYEYAKADIELLWVVERGLGYSREDHNDAATAAIAYTRYYGFPLRREVLLRTAESYKAKVRESETVLAGTNLRSSKQRLAKLREYEPWISSSSKTVLREIAKEESTVGRVARMMLEYGANKQRLDQVEKLLECRTGRAHPNLRPLGTATHRMSGTAGLNWQGIAPAEGGVGIRAALETPAGGDFSNFEIAIAASAWGDKQLLKDLSDGVDIHLIVAVSTHPDLKGIITYEEALKAKNDHNHRSHDLVKRTRTDTKRVVFGILYGAAAPKIAEVLGVDETTAQGVIDGFFQRYSGAGDFRKREERRFLTADLDKWKSDSVSLMARDAEDILGSKRHFDFEADVAATLWSMGMRSDMVLPTGTIIRQELKGAQSLSGAVRSALLGAALSIQQTVCRAAINTPIQMSGANLTKLLGQMLWDELRVPYLNIHDELIFAQHPNFNYKRIQEIVSRFEAQYKTKVTHLKFELKETQTWSDK